jgi:very-short-patch-repair endonuclease
MTPTQKRNKRVDKQKDHWALINGIPIIRIWESNITNHPAKAIQILKQRLCDAGEQKELEDKKKTREFYKNKKENAN